MATSIRHSTLSVDKKLQTQPEAFEFFQALRLLQLFDRYQSTGRTAKPSLNNMLTAEVSMGFPATEVVGITQTKYEGKTHWSLETNTLSLLGAHSALPYHYTDTVLSQKGAKTSALENFITTFEQHSLMLTQDAWKKYRPPIVIEQHSEATSPTQSHNITFDPISTVLKSLIGIGQTASTNRGVVSDFALLGFSGLLSNKRILPAVSIKRMLQHYFQIPVTIKQFEQNKKQLANDMQTRLCGSKNSKSTNNCLGVNTILGNQSQLTQSKFKVLLGPMAYKDLQAFTQKTKAAEALQELLTLSTNNNLDFDVEAEVHKEAFPPLQLSSTNNHSTLGWDTILPSRKLDSQSVNVHLCSKL